LLQSLSWAMEFKKAAACKIQTAASTSCLGSFSKCPLQRVHFIKASGFLNIFLLLNYWFLPRR
ncbi:hypothetical protein M3649_19955, partial [Ureibacillus chungkukjangi]